MMILRLYFLLLFVMAALPLSARAQDALSRPIVIEFFGSSLCRGDSPAQETAREITEANPDVIFVNCRTQVFNSEDKNDSFSRSFCDEQRKGYYNRVLPFAVRNPQIFVNGRYEMLSENILSAVKMARSIDKTEAIDLKYEDGVLDIAIPEIQNEITEGEITLYVYTSSHYGVFSQINESKVIQVGTLDKPIVPDNQDIPSSTDEKIMPVYYRPVVAKKAIGHWAGAPIRFSYNVHDIVSLGQDYKGQMSYVVLLHETDGFGPILAAGELKAEDIPVPVPEGGDSLPVSRPVSKGPDQP